MKLRMTALTGGVHNLTATATDTAGNGIVMCGQPLHCKRFLMMVCTGRVRSCVRPVYAAS